MVGLSKNKELNINYKSNTAVRHSYSYHIAILIAVFMLFYYYFNFFTQNVTSSWTGVVAIFSTFMVDVAIFYRIYRSKTLTNKAVYLLLIFFILLIGSYILNSSGVHRLLMLIMVISGIYLFVKSPLSFWEAKSLFWLYAFFVALILINTATGSENADKLNKFNPNSGGFLLTLLFCSSLTIFLKQKSSENRAIYLFACIIAFLLQFVFVSRTALLGIILYTIGIVLFNAMNKSFKCKTAFWAIIVLSVFGIVIAFIYAEVLYPAIGHGKLIVFGKDIFTGREKIWNFAFDSIKNNLWFGVGSHLNEDYYNEGYYELIMNAHNQPLGLLAACGIFVFIAFYYILSHFVSLLYKVNRDEKFNRAPLIFICVITIMSYFDIYFMSLFNLLPILLIMSIIIGSGRNKVERINML